MAFGNPLPLPRGTFVGRDDEISEIVRRLEDHLRLVSLVGPAGIGKTRLALEAALGLRAARSGTYRVIYCDLHEAVDSADVCRCLATALAASVAESTTADASIDAVGLALAVEGSALLVLDNAESAIGDVATGVSRWLDRAPGCDFLVTSREPLQVSGEQVLRIGSLDPTAACQLFLDRAIESCPSDRVASFDREQVGAIVSRLEGNPLAISLAAARTAVLSLDELEARLYESMEILSSQRRDVSRRHASLRAAIASSWGLLSDWERRAVAQCSVFRAGFSLAAVEAVVSSPHSPLELVESLYNRSLLTVLEIHGAARYSLYESVREFADGELASTNERTETERRHAEYFAALAESLATAIDRGDGADALAEIEREAANLDVASRRFADRDPGLAARCAFPLARALTLRGPAETVSTLLGPIAASAAAHELHAIVARSRALEAAALRERRDMKNALRMIEQARAAADRAGLYELDVELLVLAAEIHTQQSRLADAHETHRQLAARLESASSAICARAAYSRAVVSHLEGATAGVDHYDPSIVMCRDAGDARTEARALISRAALLLESGLAAEAKRELARALDLAARTGGLRVEGLATFSIGEIDYHLGQFEAAEAAWRACLIPFRRSGFALGEGFVANSSARLAHERGDLAEAERLCRQAQEVARACGFGTLDALNRGQLGLLALELGRPGESEAMLRGAVRDVEASGDKRYLGVLAAYWALSLASIGSGQEAIDTLRRARTQLESRSQVPIGQQLTIECIAAAIAGEPFVTQPLDQGWEVRLAERLSRLVRGEVPLRAAVEGLTVGPDARWFEWRQQRCDLSRRTAVRRVLAVLVDRRERDPGRAMSVYDLLDAGWPEENIHAEPGAQRVYWVIATLRRLGLEACLVTRDAGYLIDPSIPMRRAP